MINTFTLVRRVPLLRLFSFSFCQNVVFDENAQLKEQMEVMKENEVCIDFFICSCASVVLSKNFLTSSLLFVAYA